MEPIDPSKIAEVMQDRSSETPFTKAVSQHFAETESYVSERFSPKALSSAFTRGYEIRAVVRNAQRSMYQTADPFFQKKTRKPHKKIPINPPNLDSLIRNAPLVIRNKIKPKHLIAIREYLLENKSPKDIARDHGLSLVGVYNLINSPIVRDYVDKDSDGLKFEYQNLGRKVVENLRELLDSNSPDMKLKATELYLRKANFTPSAETLHKHEGSIDSNIQLDIKRSLLKKAGVSPEVIEATFKDITEKAQPDA